MKKNLFIILLVLIFISILTIVTILINQNNKIEEKGTASDVIHKIEDTGTISNIKYEIHNNYQGSNKRGYYVDTYNTPNDSILYIISMGEKPTGGYYIEIVDLEIDKDRNVKVTVKENSPNGGFVTQAFTYPAVCLELSEGAKSIEIKNTEGKIFKAIKQ